MAVLSSVVDECNYENFATGTKKGGAVKSIPGGGVYLSCVLVLARRGVCLRASQNSRLLSVSFTM